MGVQHVFFQVTVNQYDPDLMQIDNQVQDQSIPAKVNCVLSLPATYQATGPTTKLILWAHGAGGLVTTQDSGELAAAEPYFLPAGYALFDVNGSNNHYQTRADHMGSPRTLQAYRKAYDYLIANYNLDPQIYVHGHSMGGLAALTFASQYPSLVRCLGLVHPVTDLYHQAWLHPWLSTTRQQMASEYHFVDSTGSTYEADKVVGYNPISTNAINCNGQPVIVGTRPMKVWHGDADTHVSLAGSQAYIQAVKRGGGIADLRVVAGVGHQVVPSMYTELRFWFDRF